jgi:ubiquinone biosynthesis protein UbiJ
MPASSLFPELFAGVLRKAVTRFLRLDPNSPQYLAPLAGKVICLRLTPMDWRIYFCPEFDSVNILPSFGGEPDVTLAGSPLAFARMGLSDSPRRALFAGEVIVAGDMTAAQRFQRLFERFDIDWESLSASLTGKSIASRLAYDVRAGRAWGKDSLNAWRMNIAEYLQEESRELPAANEVDLFYADVDTLRADFDRLQARVLRLERKLSEGFASENN